MDPTSLLCWCLGTSGLTRALRAAPVRDRCKSVTGNFLRIIDHWDPHTLSHHESRATTLVMPI